MNKVSRLITNLEETRTLASNLGQLLKGGEVIYLEGDLGSGKTTFAQALIRSLGCKGPITSPTFILQQEYRCDLPILHLDLYRLEEDYELEELGLIEYLGEWIFLIEWANLFSHCLPPPVIRINFSYLNPDSREIVVYSDLDNLRGLKGG